MSIASCNPQPIPDYPRPNIKACTILPTHIKCPLSKNIDDPLCVKTDKEYLCEHSYGYGFLIFTPIELDDKEAYVDALEKALIQCKISGCQE